MNNAQGSAHAARGFTLIELLLSVAILVIITSIVYASFTSVTATVTRTREEMTEVRLRAFLTESLTTNLSSVYIDPSYALEAFRFAGVSEDTLEGPKDRFRFCSTAPLAGGAAMPGDIKEVRLEVIDPDDEDSIFSELESEQDQETYDQRTLRVTETPLLAGNVQTLSEDGGIFEAAEGFETPHWSLPIRSMDVLYFDGQEWQEEWDSLEHGRLPWAVRLQINFWRSDEEIELEKEAGINALESPEYVMTVTLPLGMGITQPLFEQDEEDANSEQEDADA